MKKLLMIIVLIACSSFTAGYPCHPNGDLGPCSHRAHSYDTGACMHIDYYGNRVHDYDYYACTHVLHIRGDVYPCTHYCY